MDNKVFAAESESVSASISYSDAEKLSDFDFSRYIANLYITDGDNPVNNGVSPYEGKVDSYHNIGHPSAGHCNTGDNNGLSKMIAECYTTYRKMREELL